MNIITKICLSGLLLTQATPMSAFSPIQSFPARRQISEDSAKGLVRFKISGLEEGDKANITIGSSEFLDLTTVDANGEYSFTSVPQGEHYVKVESADYTVSNPLKVEISEDGSVTPSSVLKFAVTKQTAEQGNSNFHFVWEEDGSLSGYTATAKVNTPTEVEFLGKMIVPADVPSQSLLLNHYQIILDDDELPWTEEYAYRLLMTMKMFEFPVPDAFDPELSIIKISLTDESLADDIEIRTDDGNKEVRISKEAFYYANPYFVRLDGVKGRFFSKRLHHALTELVTDYGRDIYKANEILMRRFGCSIINLDYERITAGITDESEIDFQMFVPSEIVALINMFEELPEGFHKTDHLNYLLRRRNDRRHPLYPEAAAVSWCVDDGYIEFMESAFGGNNQSFDTQRLILHEKTHFLWHFVFSDDIQNEWIKIGKWHEDPNSATGWLTEEDTGFVSAYAHAINPDEDMAESVAYYLRNPEWLNSRNPEKYAFIRDNIMHGTRYISQIRPDLTFEVLNLWPDYDYPGKIKKMEITSVGEPEEDKAIKIDIWLNHIEGCLDGAVSGYTRIFSPVFYDQNGKKCTHYLETYFSPVDEDLHHLSGTIHMRNVHKSGEWTSWGINLSDENGNARYEANMSDYVWKLTVDNPLEDLISPEYVAGSLKYELTEVDGTGEAEGFKMQRLRALFQGSDDSGVINHSYMGFSRGDFSYTWASWGLPYDEPEMEGWIYSDMIIPPYFPSGPYYASSINAFDTAGNDFTIRFPEDEPTKSIDIITPDPDTKEPELDLNRISVYAEPTNPEQPNGETIVTLSFFTRDDLSGLDSGSINLRDPQGGNFNILFPAVPGHNYYNGDPKEWAYHTATGFLPAGSAPGIWGVEDIHLVDKAGNSRTFSFLETLVFEPDDDDSKYILFAEMDDNFNLYIHLQAKEGHQFGYTYRIIHESTGKEIAGTETLENENAEIIRKMKQIPGKTATSVNVSSLPDGDLIVITNILDADGKIETSKSVRLQKNILTSVEELKDPDTDMQISVNGNEVTVWSKSRSDLRITMIDGRSFILPLQMGHNTFRLPSPGLYIIGSRKFIVK